MLLRVGNVGGEVNGGIADVPHEGIAVFVKTGDGPVPLFRRE